MKFYAFKNKNDFILREYKLKEYQKSLHKFSEDHKIFEQR